MAASTFDTLAAADELRDAGFDEKQARAIVGIQQNARTELATRADLAELRADIYRALWIQGTGIVVIIGAFIAIAAALAKSHLRFALGPPFDRVRAGPGGWWIWHEPELQATTCWSHSVLPARSTASAPDQAAGGSGTSPSSSPRRHGLAPRAHAGAWGGVHRLRDSPLFGPGIRFNAVPEPPLMPLLASGFRGRRLVVLAAVLSVVLSYAGAPPVHAQTEDEERTTWTGDPNDGTVQVTDASASGSTCIGDADKSPLRLEIVPGGRVRYCFRLSHEALTDGWWVMIKADGSVRSDVSEEGYKGLSWIPSIGRRVDKADSRQWKGAYILGLTAGGSGPHPKVF